MATINSITDFFNAGAIAEEWTEAASNKIDYYGAGIFPPKKKAGLDLKWIHGYLGLPASLAPSTFDAKSRVRGRIGVSVSETNMPFFRESMLVKEEDEQEILRITDSDDAYAQSVMDRIFDDANTLIEGARVVPERMIMQLLSPIGGNMGIDITSNNTAYTYNYDPNGAWAAEHYLQITDTNDMWSSAETCNPLQDIEDALDAQETASGNRPQVLLMSKATFNYIKNADVVRNDIISSNLVRTVNVTTEAVRRYVEEELNVSIVIYEKQYRDEDGVAHKFYPDNIVMMMPDAPLGSTWYGTTPEERSLTSKEADVSIVNTGVAVTVTRTTDPVNTKTTVSEICLPSFERMDECYALEVAV